MTSNFSNYKLTCLFILFAMLTTSIWAQADREKWKFQFAVGLNNPLEDGTTPGYYSKTLNFPTINLGVQHMLTNTLGAKLDLGYNRSVSDDQSLAYKLNYTRINAQLVYDAFDLFSFLPTRVNLVGHIGPGVSFTKPLNNFSENTYTFANVMAGIELHYGIGETVSIYGDLSYVLSLSSANKYDIAVDGFSFNGNLIYATIGVSVSISGCYFCE